MDMAVSADKRAILLRSYDTHKAAGGSDVDIAMALGIAYPTLRRWLSQRAEGVVAPRVSTGRKDKAEQMSAEAANRLRGLAIKTRSAHFAIKIFADDPLCPAELAEDIRECARAGRAFSPSLIRAARYTPEELAQHRGPKAMDGLRAPALRSMRVVLDTGEEIDLQPGDLIELDDMSWNQPFWAEAEGTERTRNGTSERLMARFGVSLNRQSIIARDVCSGKQLACELIARPQDAYTVIDILRFLRRLMRIIGKPRIGFRLERGVWKSRRISGKADEEMEQLASGLEAMGFVVIHAWRSQTKGGIEGSFNALQKWEAILGDGPDLGRVRGEMEHTAKLVRRVQTGAVHPMEVGFPSLHRKGEVVRQILDKYNADYHHGRIVKGVPDDIWNDGMARAPLAELSGKDLAHLLPERRSATLRGGAVTPKIGGETQVFISADLAQYGSGYRVQIAFDPEDLEMGCAVFDDEGETRRARGSMRGALLGVADWEAPAPQIAPSGVDVNGGLEVRGAIRRIHRHAFVATGLALRGVVVERRATGALPRAEAEERGPREMRVVEPTNDFTDPDMATWMEDIGG